MFYSYSFARSPFLSLLLLLTVIDKVVCLDLQRSPQMSSDAYSV